MLDREQGRPIGNGRELEMPARIRGGRLTAARKEQRQFRARQRLARVVGNRAAGDDAPRNDEVAERRRSLRRQIQPFRFPPSRPGTATVA